MHQQKSLRGENICPSNERRIILQVVVRIVLAVQIPTTRLGLLQDQYHWQRKNQNHSNASSNTMTRDDSTTARLVWWWCRKNCNHPSQLHQQEGEDHHEEQENKKKNYQRIVLLLVLWQEVGLFLLPPKLSLRIKVITTLEYFVSLYWNFTPLPLPLVFVDSSRGWECQSCDGLADTRN